METTACIWIPQVHDFYFKKRVKGSGVRPWNNLFHRTEWIISHNEQLLASTAANTEQSRLSIIQGPYAYQGHSLMYWGLIFFLYVCYSCPSKGSGLAHDSDLTVVCISIEDKRLVKKNSYQNFSPTDCRHNATWSEILFGGSESRGGVCSIMLGSRSRSCSVNTSMYYVLATQCVVYGVNPWGLLEMLIFISTQDLLNQNLCLNGSLRSTVGRERVLNAGDTG